ncbi:hypothetical protein Bpfe_029244 [Biomphalaria pfeifferi]|uniref:Uncharacterized protein n=1 Tax=Biomphalaria pfeifferi TaxID=112525 RepID=A0AAD8ARX5_BIOPF|nr:hypothetical protein Bpfe_029244 [Biomphalaria pfeifferi]
MDRVKGMCWSEKKEIGATHIEHTAGRGVTFADTPTSAGCVGWERVESLWGGELINGYLIRRLEVQPSESYLAL